MKQPGLPPSPRTGLSPLKGRQWEKPVPFSSVLPRSSPQHGRDISRPYGVHRKCCLKHCRAAIYGGRIPRPSSPPQRKCLPCARGGGPKGRRGCTFPDTYNPPVSKLTAPFTQGGLWQRLLQVLSPVPAHGFPMRLGAPFLFTFHSSLFTPPRGLPALCAGSTNCSDTQRKESTHPGSLYCRTIYTVTAAKEEPACQRNTPLK